MVLNRLSKVAHFIPVHTIEFASYLTLTYICEIVRLHGVHQTTNLIGMLRLHRSPGRA
jgi:hypothetical protein